MDKEMLINLVCERNLKKIENEFGSFSLGTTLGQGGTAIVREATLAGSTRRCIFAVQTSIHKFVVYSASGMLCAFIIDGEVSL